MIKGTFVVRAVAGAIVLGHGLQKLTGAFDGPGLEGTEQVTKSLGLYPPKQQALAVALSETIGGGLTIAGALSPLGPAMIIGTQAVAIHKVHLKNGFWNSKGGYEFNLLLIAAAFSVAGQGPNLLSIDGILRKRRVGLKWALFATALGLGTAAAVVKAGEALAPGSSGYPGDDLDEDADRPGAVDLAAGAGTGPSANGALNDPVVLEDEV